MQVSVARELIAAAKLSRKKCSEEIAKVVTTFDRAYWLLPIRSTLVYFAALKAKSKVKNLVKAINELEHFVPDDVHVLSEMHTAKELIKKADVNINKLLKTLPILAVAEVVGTAIAVTLLYNIM